MNILVVANPTADLACDAELAALTEQQGQHGRYRVNVRVLREAEATRARFVELAAGGQFDIVHFAGHAALNRSAPDSSALRLADGPLTAGEVVRLPWSAPPYLVFNSACESGRAVGGRRLVSRGRRANGLAAAFLAAGVRGYIGYFWPVTDTGAALFARAFYHSLFDRENVGLAVLDARRIAQRDLGDAADLTGYSAVLFGDAASQQRQDLATAV